MNKKNRVFRVASLLLVLCFVSTVMISGTFAKYTSEFSGQDTALIAKWDVTVSGGQGNDLEALTDGSPAATLDLFSHAYDVNIVEGAGADKIIAPGVSGEFTLSVTNKSDVAAGVEFEFDVSGDAVDVPIEYSLSSNFDETYTISYVDSELVDNLGPKVAFSQVDPGETPETPIKVYWRWAFEKEVNEDPSERDISDTALGVASADKFNDEETEEERTEYILTVTATATQIAPETIP